MGESQSRPFQLSLNRFLRVAFQGSRVTSDGGLILVRELDERFSLRFILHLIVRRTQILGPEVLVPACLRLFSPPLAPNRPI